MSVALKQQWQRLLDARWLVPCLLLSGLASLVMWALRR